LTDDLLLGSSATSSAKFAFINVQSGTPTASISAGTSGGIYLNANGTIATTANQSLTLGDNHTGNIILNGFATGIIHSVGGILSSAAVGLGGGDVSGILPVTKGGTGTDLSSSAAIGDILYA